MKTFQTIILSHVVGKTSSKLTLEVPRELSALLINSDPEPRLVISLKDEQSLDEMGHEVPGDPDYEDEVKKPLITVLAEDFFRALARGDYAEKIEHELFRTIIVFKHGFDGFGELDFAALRLANLSYVKLNSEHSYKVGLFSDLMPELNEQYAAEMEAETETFDDSKYPGIFEVNEDDKPIHEGYVTRIIMPVDWSERYSDGLPYGIVQGVLNGCGGLNLPHKQVLKSGAGFYIGWLSFDKGAKQWWPEARDSQDYWRTYEEAKEAMIKGNYDIKF